MLAVTISEQEKKDLAVIYGFLRDVWAAQQLQVDLGHSGIRQVGVYAGINHQPKNLPGQKQGQTSEIEGA